jgi:hypothetical protein
METYNAKLISADFEESTKPPLLIASVSGSVCPKCGCTDYEEWEELEYEKGGDDPMYGGELVSMKFTRCGECD